MKKLLLLPFIFFAFFCSAQNVKLNIHFTDDGIDSCSLRIDKFHLTEFEPIFLSKAINKNCLFQITIDTPCLAELHIKNQSFMLWLEPNDDLKLNINDMPNETYTIEGNNAAHTNFLKSFYSKFKRDYNKDSIKQQILRTSIDPFENTIYTARENQLDFFKRASSKEKFSTSFTSYMNHLIRYHYFYQLQAYPIITANDNQGLTVTQMPAILLEDITPELANHDDALNCESYRNFLNYYIVYNTSKLNAFEKFTDHSISMEAKISCANNLLHGKSNIYFMASYLDENVPNVSPYTAKHMYGLLSVTEKKGEYTKLLKQKCEQRIKDKDANNTAKKSGEGSNNGDVKIMGTNGKYFTFDDLKGKVVYIDFWASWCGPCRGQFPYSKELHSKFTPKQLKKLVFLYISIDKTEEIWKKAIEMNGLGDFKNGLVPGDWSSEIVKYFKISSIPRYMLIDKNGKMVDQDAKRPSDPAIMKDIVHLIGD